MENSARHNMFPASNVVAQLARNEAMIVYKSDALMHLIQTSSLQELGSPLTGAEKTLACGGN